MSLVLEEMGVEELVPKHVYGTANKSADALSRLAAPDCALMPSEVMGAKRRECPTRTREFYALPPPKNKALEVINTQAEGKTAFACPWSSRQAHGGCINFGAG